MKYRELLKLYKEGKLDEEQKKQVEAALEKYEAISEYLFEREKIPALDDIMEEMGMRDGEKSNHSEKNESVKKETGKGEQDFVNLVNRSIRNWGRKTAISAIALALVAVLFVQIALPKIVSTFYYNPAKKNGEYSNQMSLDMCVYTELLIPGYKRSNVTVDEKGYGNYDFCIQQNISYNRTMTSVSGEINKGKIKYYNNNLLKEPTGNAFVWFQAIGDLSKPLSEGMDPQYDMSAAGKREEAEENLNWMDEQDYYIGYVSLNEMMDYETFSNYLDKQEENGLSIINPWCAVQTKSIVWDTNTNDEEKMDTFHADNIGFECRMSHSESLEWDEEKYPNLITWKQRDEDTRSSQEIHTEMDDLEDNMKKESFMREHFVSLLTYMADQKDFLKMMEKDSETYREAAEYVKENGITVYGFAAIMQKDTAMKLINQDEIYSIYVQKLI